MFWFILLVMVVVLGAAALVALGAGGSLPEAEQDRVSARLPQERPLNRQDIDELRFPMALRGYRMDEVDDVLDRLGAELTQRDAHIASLEAQLAGAHANSLGAFPQPTHPQPTHPQPTRPQPTHRQDERKDGDEA